MSYGDEVRDIGARGSGASIDAITQQEKESRNVDWIKTVMDPRSFNMLPDQTIENGNSVPNVIDFTMTYDITDPVPANYNLTQTTAHEYCAEMCSSKSGLFLQFPQRGTSATYHMGFVGQTASTAAPLHINIISPTPRDGSTCRGLTSFPTVYQGAPNYNSYWATQTTAVLNAIDTIGCFAWYGPVALPRNGRGAIQVGLNVGRDFSKARVYAGLIQVSGNAVSMTAASLTGTVSCGVVADTRDLANNSSEPWGVAALAQQSISRKDVVKTERMDDGITSIIGDDYQRLFDAPDKSVTRRSMGEAYYVTQTLSYGERLIGGTYADNVLQWQNRVPTAYMSAWITPWNCNHWYALNNQTSSTIVQPQFHNLIKVPAIDETGSLKVSITVPWDAYYNGSGAVPGQTQPSVGANDNTAHVGAECRVLFIHYYCYINDDGTVQYNTRSELQREARSFASHQWYQSYAQAQTGTANFLFPSRVFVSDAAQFRGDFVQQGKYVGTYVQIFFACNNGLYRPQNGTTPTVPGAASTDYPTAAAAGGFITNIEMGRPSIEVVATSIDEPGNIGPCHVIRYDGLSVDQQLTLRGISRFQGNPNGAIAPYVQDSIANAKYVFSSQTQGLLRALFRSNPYFRRMMTTKYYETEVLPYVRELSAGSMLQESSNKPEVVAHGEQAGLFHTIGSTVGNIADMVFGGGAGGQFGAGSSAGQFGVGGGAAGQFGLGYSSGVRRNFRA